MAAQADIIDSIRRQVSDYFDGVVVNQRYNNNFYIDAINQSLSRLSSDLGQDFSLSTIPFKYEWALILLGSIHMCDIRSMEQFNGQQGDDGDDVILNAGSIKRIEHKNQVVEHFETKDGSWDDLCKRLWKRYDSWLDDIEEPIDDDILPVVTCSTINRSNPRNYFRHAAKDDYAIDISDLYFNVVEIPEGLYFEWDKVQHNQFCSYRIFMHLANEHYKTRRQLIKSITNPLTLEYLDESFLELAEEETYVYTLVVTNTNGLESKATQLVVTK